MKTKEERINNVMNNLFSGNSALVIMWWGALYLIKSNGTVECDVDMFMYKAFFTFLSLFASMPLISSIINLFKK